MPAPAFDREIVVEQPMGLRRVGWLVAMLLSTATMAAGLAHALLRGAGSAWPGLGMLAFGLAAMVLSVVRFVRAGRKGNKAVMRVHAEGGALSVDGQPRFSRVKSAHVQPRDGAPWTVRVTGSRSVLGETVDLAMADEESADALMRALGVDPTHSIARFRVFQGVFANKTAQTVVSMMLAFGGFNMVNMLPVGLKFPALAILGVLTLINLTPSGVSVGPDGVLLRTALRRKFFPFSQMETAEPTEWGVAFVMKSGRRVELRTRPSKIAAKGTDETRDALLFRIKKGIAALGAAEPPADVSSLVARAGRSGEEWLRALGMVARSNMGYRVAAVPPEQLWRVVEDPGAEPTARAGAAMALRASLDGEGRARLRAAAANSVHPKVRVALDAVATSDGSDDDAVEEALLECDDDEGEARRARRH